MEHSRTTVNLAAKDQRTMNGTGERTDRAGGLALLAIVIIFLPLAWNHNWLWGWVQLSVDCLLLALLLIPTLLLQRILLGTRDWGLLRWWALGAALILVIVVAANWVLPQDNDWVLYGTFLAGLVSLAIVFAATVGANPQRLLTHDGRVSDPDAWRRFLPGIPLLLGTFAAWIGNEIWFRLNANAIRTFADALEVARREGSTGPVEDLCVGAVGPEYFAQLSQVIPLLLVALGVERRFFEHLLREPVQWALTIFTVLLLCFGEATAISALPSPNRGCGNVLSIFHEHLAFTFTLLSCFIALATLLWALVIASPTPGSKPAAGPQDEG
jgi:hypothetical protein